MRDPHTVLGSTSATPLHPMGRSLGRWSSRAVAGACGKESRLVPLALGCEQLEARQLLASIFAVTDGNVLLQFDSDSPGVIQRATAINGLGAGETIAAMDFKPGANGAAGTLFGVASGNRTPFYTIDPSTGVATRFVAPGFPRSGLSGSFPVEYAVGLDYDDLTNTFRYTDENGGGYRFNGDNLFDFVNFAGIDKLTDLAFRPTGGNSSLFALSGAIYSTDEFVTINPANGQVLTRGALGLDIERWVGLDTAADGRTFVSVRSGGLTRFGTISQSDGHTFEEIGTIGAGTSIVRGLSIDPSTPSAPVLNTTLAPSLASIIEDGDGGEGTSIAALIASVSGSGDLITDTNPAALEGVALVGASDTNGVWEYALDGVTWNALGQVSESSALLLPSNGTARIRFVPNVDFSGTLTQALRIRAWDQTGAVVGERVAIGPGGGESGFSIEGVWASITVSPTRDAPTIVRASGAPISITEKQTTRPFEQFTIGYIDSATRTLMTTVTLDPALGTFTIASLAAAGFATSGAGGSAFIFLGTASQATAAARLLVYKPSENIAPIGQESISVLVITVDDLLGAPAQLLSPSIAALSVRDGPVVAGIGTLPISIDDRQTAIPFGTVTILDIDSADQPLTIDVTIPTGAGTLTAESLAASGFVMFDSATYRFVGTAAQGTDATRLLVFRPTENMATPGTTTPVTLGFGVTDNLGPAVISVSPTIQVLSVNDSTTLVGAIAVNKIKMGKSVKLFRRIAVGDADSGESLTAIIKLDKPLKGNFTTQSLAASGFVRIARGQFRFIGVAGQVQSALRTLSYKFNSGLSTTSTQQVRFRLTVTDTAGTALVNNQTTTTLRM